MIFLYFNFFSTAFFWIYYYSVIVLCSRMSFNQRTKIKATFKEQNNRKDYTRIFLTFLQSDQRASVSCSRADADGVSLRVSE